MRGSIPEAELCLVSKARKRERDLGKGCSKKPLASLKVPRHVASSQKSPQASHICSRCDDLVEPLLSLEIGALIQAADSRSHILSEEKSLRPKVSAMRDASGDM